MLLFLQVGFQPKSSPKIIRMSSNLQLLFHQLNKQGCIILIESLCPITCLESGCNSPSVPALTNRLLCTYMTRINNMGDEGLAVIAAIVPLSLP
jgi:hypothetical protein